MRSPASAIVFKIRADDLEGNCSCVWHFMKALNPLSSVIQFIDSLLHRRGNAIPQSKPKGIIISSTPFPNPLSRSTLSHESIHAIRTLVFQRRMHVHFVSLTGVQAFIVR